jgi:hypothetical protein
MIFFMRQVSHKSVAPTPPHPYNPRAGILLRQAAVSSDTFHHRGAVAQLGERLLRTQEVIGSIPFSSTKIVIRHAAERPLFLFARLRRGN